MQPELQEPHSGSENSSGDSSSGGQESVQYKDSMFKACPVSKSMPQQTKYIDSGSVCSGEGIAVDLRGLAGATVAVGRVRKRVMMAPRRLPG